MLHDFAALGSIDPQFQRVGIFEGTHVAAFNFTDPSIGPSLFIEGDQGLVPLSSLLGPGTVLGPDGRIVDLFEGSLGVLIQGSDGQGNTAFYVTSWETSPVPGPASAALLLIGGTVAGPFARRAKRRGRRVPPTGTDGLTTA